MGFCKKFSKKMMQFNKKFWIFFVIPKFMGFCKQKWLNFGDGFHSGLNLGKEMNNIS